LIHSSKQKLPCFPSIFFSIAVGAAIRGKTMHVVAIGSRGIPGVQGGIENHCEHLYSKLSARGVKISLLGRLPYIHRHNYVHNGIEVIGLAVWRSKYFETITYALKATLLAKRFNADIVHYHGIGPSLMIPIARRLKLTTVATHHGFDYDRDKWGAVSKFFLKLGEKKMCRSDAVIVISEHIAGYLSNRYSCRPFYIPNGVKLQPILPAGRYCVKYSLESQKYLLFVGRFVPEKSIIELVGGFRKLKTDWKLVIAGDNTGSDQYSRRVNDAAQGYTNIVLTGFVTGAELQELYSNAGCFVLPSSHEGLPIALLEALSFGLPCVVSDIPAHRAVRHENISYFELRNEDNLVSILDKICKISSGMDRNSSRIYVKENFDWNQIAADTAAVYSKVTQQDTGGINSSCPDSTDSEAACSK
jgi:glycosyltransferase involved in cell wall biosynthesis